jgi:hypothetical protein
MFNILIFIVDMRNVNIAHVQQLKFKYKCLLLQYITTVLRMTTMKCAMFIWSMSDCCCNNYNVKTQEMLTVSRVTGTSASWYFWTSGSDQAQEGSWFWTGSGARFSLTQYVSTINRGTCCNCLVTHREGGGSKLQFHDSPCSTTHNFICEMSSVWRHHVLHTKHLHFILLYFISLHC